MSAVPEARVGAVPEALSAEMSPVRLAFDGPLAVLTLNRPPANLFDTAMLRAFSDAVDWLAANSPRGLLVRADGRVVSAGLDVEIFNEVPPDEAAAFWSAHLGAVQALERLPCPTVFAAHSLTLTAAFEIALACDLIVATRSARFGLVERKVAFTPAMGGTQRLAQRAGVGRACELVMTGDVYRGETLAEWGVVNALFPADSFHGDAHAYAMRLATGPTRAHAATKQILRGFQSGGVARSDEMLPKVAADLVRTRDHRRAVAAFIEHGPDHTTSYDG
ncbi:enoyl-CoA hydratase/isomerase family protein [Planotetraspora sp. A-T 1434]|uniref:enoyl-CoA hydratase/isomerase family protein n=1 Tax=Planotetraspora sp. A-T 1434 TaxID=2979219 RepID=UPI0021C1C381|nr:enoyl-CoA hydratase/isomerase family protein [Planotetraspora sp. A-T 1434]MCT9935340.1 enoyl-CoA hydratase/isomerase family protein [Planotetraspora sp. A-T 1434]